MFALEKIIGAEALAKLSAERGGEYVYVPRQLSRGRNLDPDDLHEIALMRKAGRSVKLIARQLGFTQRSILKALARKKLRD